MTPAPVEPHSRKTTRACAWLARCLRALALTALAALLAPALLTAQPAPSSDAVLIPDNEIVARAAALPIEERRYLIYLYSRLEKPRVAAALAEDLLAAYPDDRQTLVALASIHLEEKDAPATLRLARRLLEAHPGDAQALYFLGAGHYLAKDFAEAARVFRDLKREQFTGRPFPYEADLAASALAAGDWRGSLAAYEELLRHDPLSDEFRAEVRRARDSLYREHRPRLELSAAQTRLDHADVWRLGALHGRHLTDRHWLDVRYGRDEVTLEPAPGLRGARIGREEIAANLNTTHGRRWRSEISAGVSGEGALGLGRLHHVFAPQREISLELAGRVRATDSLALEALDGRQDHAALTFAWLVKSDLTFVTRAHTREVRIAGTSLGRGSGLDANLDHTFAREGPRISAGYRGSIAHFSPDATFDAVATAPIADPAGGGTAQQAIAANLVSRRINRHGTGLLVTDNLADAWLYRLTAGVDYDFELSSVGWNAGVALTFFPRRNLELTAEASHTSSATASNAGSAATLLSFFIRAHF